MCVSIKKRSKQKHTKHKNKKREAMSSVYTCGVYIVCECYNAINIHIAAYVPVSLYKKRSKTHTQHKKRKAVWSVKTGFVQIAVQCACAMDASCIMHQAIGNCIKHQCEIINIYK